MSCGPCAHGEVLTRCVVAVAMSLTGDARPRFFESYALNHYALLEDQQLRCGAREAMTVGCKPTSYVHVMVSFLSRAEKRGSGEGP